eukprot:Clim_evm48s77 gene=Clim_evmTU48s77
MRENEITLLYHTGWDGPFIHFNGPHGWTQAPGVKMDECQLPGFEGGSWKRYTIEAGMLEFCFNDGGSNWDNPSTGGNYHVNSNGIYIVDNGRVFQIENTFGSSQPNGQQLTNNSAPQTPDTANNSYPSPALLSREPSEPGSLHEPREWVNERPPAPARDNSVTESQLAQNMSSMNIQPAHKRLEQLPHLRKVQQHTGNGNHTDFLLPIAPEASDFHTVAYEVFDDETLHWDGQHHVYLPYMNKEEWKIIGQALTKLHKGATTQNPVLIETSMLSYLDKEHTWDFNGLIHFLDEMLDDQEKFSFFRVTLKNMIASALSIQRDCPKPIPLLCRGMNHAVTLQRAQIVSLLANQFLLTSPTYQKGNLGNFPSLNWSSLFEATAMHCPPYKAAKLRALIHYFNSVTAANADPGAVTFIRRCLDLSNNPNLWLNCDRPLCSLTLAESKLEDCDPEHLQVVFSHKMFAEGFFGRPSAVEEAAHFVCPELLVGRCFIESLAENEAIVVIGAQRFNHLKGHLTDLTYNGPAEDKRRVDRYNRRQRVTVFMDTKSVNVYKQQMKRSAVLRDLNKTLTAFMPLPLRMLGSADVEYLLEVSRDDPTLLCDIATGNWGSGGSRADREIKAIIQIIAASFVGRNIVYHYHNDLQFGHKIESTVAFLREKQVTVSQLYKALVNLCEHVPAKGTFLKRLEASFH